MRILVLSAATITLGACQPAAEPQPVDAQVAAEEPAAAPVAGTQTVTQDPALAGPVAVATPPRASPSADPMAGHDMSKMDGMTMPPSQ